MYRIDIIKYHYECWVKKIWGLPQLCSTIVYVSIIISLIEGDVNMKRLHFVRECHIISLENLFYWRWESGTKACNDWGCG